MHFKVTACSTVALEADSNSISRQRQKVVNFLSKKPAKQEPKFTIPSLEKVPDFSTNRRFVIPVKAAYRCYLSPASKFLGS